MPLFSAPIPPPRPPAARLPEIVVSVMVRSPLIAALPGMGSMFSIIFLVFYVAAVLATNFFGDAFSEWFGSIGKSLFSLFQIMTLESWSMGIVRPIMEQYPGAWAFFLPFIIVTTFTAGPQQTLPLWILQNLSRPNQLPVVNVVALLVVLLSAIPVYVAQKLTQEAGVLGHR